ncbi:MAG: hypothetical protein ACRBFS_11375 [Aureispira sp.]
MKFIDKTGTPPSRLEQWKAYHKPALNQRYANPDVSGADLWKFLGKKRTL